MELAELAFDQKAKDTRCHEFGNVLWILSMPCWPVTSRTTIEAV